MMMIDSSPILDSIHMQITGRKEEALQAQEELEKMKTHMLVVFYTYAHIFKAGADLKKISNQI